MFSYMLCIIFLLLSVESKIQIIQSYDKIDEIKNNRFIHKKEEPKQVDILIEEGSMQIYSMCSEICEKENKSLYYAETTNFPGYGLIYRCQCEKSWTGWYDSNGQCDQCDNIILGDELFNNYMNILGYEPDDCSCQSLKELTLKMVQNGPEIVEPPQVPEILINKF